MIWRFLKKEFSKDNLQATLSIAIAIPIFLSLLYALIYLLKWLGFGNTPSDLFLALIIICGICIWLGVGGETMEERISREEIEREQKRFK